MSVTTDNALSHLLPEEVTKKPISMLTRNMRCENEYARQYLYCVIFCKPIDARRWIASI